MAELELMETFRSVSARVSKTKNPFIVIIFGVEKILSMFWHM